MEPWKDFEQLVARIHAVLHSDIFVVTHNVKVKEPSGQEPQIDVLLTPKSGFGGPIFISCKNWSAPVEVDHIREWSDIVQHCGAAGGVVVSRLGFSSGAIRAAQDPTRRISLWRVRPLTDDDFAPDEKSATGYMAGVRINGLLLCPQLIPDTVRLDVSAVDPKDRGRQIAAIEFSEVRRAQWYMRDSQDGIVGNLVDDVGVRMSSFEETGTIEIVPVRDTFIVLEGIRLRLKSFSVGVEVQKIECPVDIDFRRDAFAYENVITKEIRTVPLPASLLPPISKTKSGKTKSGKTKSSKTKSSKTKSSKTS